MHYHYHMLTTWLEQHPQWGLAAAFLIALIECIPVIGTIIPGSVTMTIIGVFVGCGVLPLVWTLAAAVVGAIIGDSIGLLIGYAYQHRIEYLWPFNKHRNWLLRGRQFIAKHGGKSIVMGRFIGIIRAIIPLVAGVLRIPLWKFYLADVISAIAWAIAYMLPGFLLGIASLAIPAGMASKLMLFIVITLIIIWVASWLLRLTWQWLCQQLTRLSDGLWLRIKEKKRYVWLCYLLRCYHKPPSFQLVLALVWLAMVLLFIIVMLNVSFNGPLVRWNIDCYHLFRGLHALVMTKVMIVITTLANKQLLLPVGVIMITVLFIRRRWLTAWHFCLLLLLVTGGVFIVKHIIQNPRPVGLLYSPHGPSFPSGHSALAVAVYGFIAYLLANYYRRQWRIIYLFTVIACLLIALSRLYLGAHWLTDILGGMLFGFCCLLLVIISYRRHQMPLLSLWEWLLPLLIALIAVNGYYLYRNYHQLIKNYTLVWPQYNLTIKDWWWQKSNKIPLYRNSRLGYPDQILNVQWAGTLDNITATLLRHHWHLAALNNFVTLLKEATEQHKITPVAIIEKLYDDQAPKLIAVKIIHRHVALLSLWQANIKLGQEQLPLWVGTLYYQKNYRKKRLLAHHHFYHSLMGELILALDHYHYRITTIASQHLAQKLTRQIKKPYYVIIIRPKGI